MADNAKPAAPQTTAIVHRDPQTGLASFEPDSLDKAIDLCDRLSKSGLLPPMLVGKPAEILTLTLTGRDLGLTMMQSLQSIQIIEGRPNLSAKLKVALVRRHPLCKYFRLVESTDKIAVWATHREGNEPTMEKFTWDEAVKAGLVHKTKTGSPGMYEKWPKQMLRARAATQLCDREYQDVLLNLADDIEPGGAIDAEFSRKMDEEFQQVEPMPTVAAPAAPKAKPAAQRAAPVRPSAAGAPGEPCRRCGALTERKDEEGKPWCSLCEDKAKVADGAVDADFTPAEPAAAAPAAAEPAADPSKALLDKLASAATKAELDEALKTIQALPEDQREPFRAPYKAAKLRIESAEAPQSKE